MRAAVPAVVGLLVATQAAAGAASFPAARDATLIEATDGSVADGSGPHVRAGSTNQGPGGARRGLLAFDVESAIPPGARILSATLILHESGNNPVPVEVTLHRALQSWGEGSSAPAGGSGAIAAPGDATWFHRFHNPAAPDSSPAWSAPGGDFAGPASAATTVVGQGFYSWTSTAMAEDVRFWLQFPASNAGWVLLGDESLGQSVKRFDSRNNADATVRPLLIVEFATPLPQGASR
jgi:hypothetical protein